MKTYINTSQSMILLCALSFNSWAQTASLRGSVSDALNASPLGGVSIVIDSKTSGVSGPNGHYEVSGLKLGSEITLVYDKGGYSQYSVKVRLNAPKLVRDVGLLKETLDAAYWSSWSEKRLSGSDVQNAWQDVQHSALSAESKRLAARSLLAELPSRRGVPPDLLASAGAKDKDEIVVSEKDASAEEENEIGITATDRYITHQVVLALSKDKYLSTYVPAFKIFTQNGMVTLKGPVTTEAEKKMAEQTAEQVAGAGKVTNKLSVQPKIE
jgi:hyperosmotically inducible periplasmic protein